MPCSSSGQAFRAPTAAQLIQPLVRRLKSTRWRSGSENEQNNAMSSSTEPTAADGRSHAIWSEICLPAGGVFRTYELRVEPSASAADAASVQGAQFFECCFGYLKCDADLPAMILETRYLPKERAEHRSNL